MKESCFKIEKKNYALTINHGDLTVGEVASGIRSYLDAIAHQESFSREELIAEFFKLVEEADIPQAIHSASFSA